MAYSNRAQLDMLSSDFTSRSRGARGRSSWRVEVGSSES